jgi:hypothetical protein
MKSMSFKFVAVLFAALVMVFAVSCDKEEDKPAVVDNTPVLDKNFSFVINKNEVTFSTTLTGTVWFTSSGVDYPVVDKKSGG